jgi:hypothetical protein
VFFKGNFCKDSNQIGENFDENKNEKTNFNQYHSCACAGVAVGFRHSYGGQCRETGSIA